MTFVPTVRRLIRSLRKRHPMPHAYGFELDWVAMQ